LYNTDTVLLNLRLYRPIKMYIPYLNDIDAMIAGIRSTDIHAKDIQPFNTSAISWTRNTKLNLTIYLAITWNEKEGRGRRRKSLLILHALVPFHDFYMVSSREVCHYRATTFLARFYANHKTKLRRKQLKITLVGMRYQWYLIVISLVEVFLTLQIIQLHVWEDQETDVLYDFLECDYIYLYNKAKNSLLKQSTSIGLQTQ